MRRSVGLGIALAVCAAVDAAEPAAVVPVTPVAPVTQTPPANPIPITKKPLNLRIGDVRKYMMPDEYREALGAPDADKNTVVVEAKRELLPVEYEEPIPIWPLGPLYWALKNPANSWRILLPDINRGPAGPPDVVPPPVFRRGP